MDIAELDGRKLRITVKQPDEFAGYWLEFSRNTGFKSDGSKPNVTYVLIWLR